jgi:hypothetical protein
MPDCSPSARSTSASDALGPSLTPSTLLASPDLIERPLAEMVHFWVYDILAGYEDQNAPNTLPTSDWPARKPISPICSGHIDKR